MNAPLIIDIRSAFPSSVALSHSDCEELRRKIVSLRDEDVPPVLGLVLIDLLETHADAMARAEWTDSVVRFLCAAEPPFVPDAPNYMGSLNSKQFNDFAASQQPEAEALFAKFTTKQARAIYGWLEAAQSWEELQSSADELAAALKYWKRKSGL